MAFLRWEAQARRLALFLAASLFFVPPAAAEVALVPIAYHPYPDDADPLGFPAFTMGERGWDRFVGAYSFLDQERDGFDFPSLVVDGNVLVEGTGGGTYEGTLEQYRDAFDQAKVRETPVVMRINSSGEGEARHIEVDLQGADALLSETGLRLHWVITEDDVYYKPPPALSNGVFIHRFTARDADPWPGMKVRFEEDGSWNGAFDLRLDPEWDMDRLAVAVWVQNHADDSTGFDFGEVLQATLHPLDVPGTTEQRSRGVLLEMFTATWCPACLFGDSALDTLAAENGLASDEFQEPTARYLRSPQWLPLSAGAFLGTLASAALLLRRRS